MSRGVAGNIIVSIATLKRIRHFRGHGIHSPFVYSLVRNVFMEKKFISGDTALYDRLRTEGIEKRGALQLQNFYSYCGFTGFEFTETADGTDPESALLLVRPSAAPVFMEQILDGGNRPRNTVVLIAHRTDRKTRRVAGSLVSRKMCMSIDKGNYMIFLFGRKLPAQHHKL